MGWWGKIIGGGIGFAAGGPIGSAIGVGIGHLLDRENAEEASEGYYSSPSCASMGEFEVRLIEKNFDDENGEGGKGVVVEGRGLAPIDSSAEIAFVLSLFDVTEGKDPQPVLSLLDTFQESESAAYQFVQQAGHAEPGHGYEDWTPLGYVFFDLLIPPKRGQRTLEVFVRVVDASSFPSSPPIHLGVVLCAEGLVFNSYRLGTWFHFSELGWLEEAEGKEESRGLAVRLGIAVAMADDSFDPTEGKVIQQWVHRILSHEKGEDRERIKNLCNTAMREAYKEAQGGTLYTNELTQRLKEIAPVAQKYEAVELCYEVMAADGVADEAELNILRRIADGLDLDYEEIEKIRDRAMLGLGPMKGSGKAGLEGKFGIDPSWPQDRIRKQIRTEFTKWNGRLSSLPQGQERDNAQQMLEDLAELRKKYG